MGARLGFMPVLSLNPSDKISYLIFNVKNLIITDIPDVRIEIDLRRTRYSQNTAIKDI